MTGLEIRAREVLPATKENVERVFRDSRHGLSLEDYELRAFCVSHERLRLDLQGAETLLAEQRAEIAAVLADLDKLGGVWSGMAIIDACRDRLRKLLGKE